MIVLNIAYKFLRNIFYKKISSSVFFIVCIISHYSQLIWKSYVFDGKLIYKQQIRYQSWQRWLKQTSVEQIKGNTATKIGRLESEIERWACRKGSMKMVIRGMDAE